MHIASCVNKKIISIFGPTHPKRKSPLWKESISIWKDSKNYDFKSETIGKKQNKIFMENISVDDILRRVK